MFFTKERLFLILLNEEIVFSEIIKILKHDYNVTLSLSAKKIITLIIIIKRLNKLNVTHVIVIINVTSFLKEVRDSFVNNVNKIKVTK